VTPPFIDEMEKCRHYERWRDSPDAIKPAEIANSKRILSLDLN